MEKITKLYEQTPDWVKTGLWIGLSAGVTATVSHLLERPELVPYYGILNFVLYALKEAEKKRRSK